MRQLPGEPNDSRPDAHDIAVIGMAGRFPGARDLAAFWANIAGGVESIRALTDAELAAAGVPASIRESASYVPAASRLEDADCFDAALFGYSPRDAALMDPQGRVCLELAWHALEDAGYSPLDMAGAVGVFASASLSTYLLHHVGRQLDPQDFILGLGNIPIVLGNGPDFIATRVAYKLNLRGPAVAVQAACSSSLTAIHLARQSLLSGECDVALAGGVSIYLPQDRGYLYQDGMILSPDGHCRAFDADAGGIVFGRGGGLVALKALDRAIEDGDRIRAVIRGSAVNNDGSRKVGFTAPSVAGQSRVIAEALADAGVRADSIGYVEAHGTGTKLGDPIEVAALTEAYRQHTTRSGYCAIGTVKANIGHLDVAAGVTGFIKTVLMLEHGLLPPSLNVRRPNPAIDFAASPFYVNTALQPWARHAGPRRAGVSAFGIGGTNVHVILEEAPAAPVRTRTAERPMHVLRLTARTEEALAALTARVAGEVAREAAPPLGDVCHTANTGRAHLAHRVVVRGTSAGDLRDGLRAAAAGELDPRVTRGVAAAGDAPPVAFLFTGLGAQAVDMGRALFEHQPVFRAALQECDALLRPHLPTPLLGVIYPGAGPTSPIEETTYGQPVMFAFEYALARLWHSWGVRPAAMLGHSLGEYTAACLSGLLPLHEALRLVATRARLADSLPPGGGMTAAFTAEAQALEAIGPDAHRVSIASINSPESVVLSGPAEAVARVAARLAARGVEVRVLKVSQAFHSVWLDPILDQYEQAVAQTTFGRLEIPVVSNVTGRLLGDAEGRDPRYWRRHARHVVRFADGVRTLYDRGIRTFVEIGPHTTATAMAAGCVNDDQARFLPSLRRGRDDWDQILETLSELYARGVEIDWAGVDATPARRRVALPLYPFARTRHWVEAAAGATPADPREAAHPMLGRPVSSPLFAEPVYELAVDPARHAFLGDHRLFGAAVFPATGYLEAAREAMTAVADRRATVLEDVEIAAALTLTGEGDHAQLILRPDDEGFGFEVFSRVDRDGRDGWRKHASGRLTGTPRQTTCARLDVDAILARCTDTRTGADFYGELAPRGFAYGPRFQGITSLAIGDGEVLARVRLVDALEADAPRFQFHPALLDACLQAALALVPADRTFLPVRLGRVELGEPQSPLVAHVVRRTMPSGARTCECDVRIADASGAVIGAITGIVLQDAESVGGFAPPLEWERWLYEPTWRLAPLDPQSPPGPDTSTRWLIVDDGTGAAARLASRMALAGSHAETARAAALVEQPAAILAAAAGDGSLDGIVYVGTQAVAGDTTADVSPLLTLVQALGAHAAASSPRLWIVTRGAQGVVAGDDVNGLFAAPLWGLANVISLEHPELRCSCVDLDAIDDAAMHALLSELGRSGPESRVALRAGVRHVARLSRAAVRKAGIHRPEANRGPVARRLESADPGLLDALRYREEPRRTPAPGEVEIDVRAAGLNFKDVLTALGRFPMPASGLGHECAGVVSAVGAGVTDLAVGDAVIAFEGGSLGTHVIANAHLVAKKPAAVSFEQGATVAGGFLTAHHGLIDLAALGPGDRVLIHAATGGVGLAAVQLATRAGATVFATAGSEAKRALLASMGVAHVFDSRTTAFADEVARLTNHRGVTVVLNSLTGDARDLSAALLARGGRFVELGRGADGASARPRLPEDAVYAAPDVAGECAANPAAFGARLRNLVAAVERGDLSPLPYRAFDAEFTVEAFRLMARAGHVGKVVVRPNAGERHTHLRPDAAYLVVGGFGGVGLLVAEHLADRGARTLALMGRGGPGAESQPAIDRLASRGVRVLAITGDVSRRSDVDGALAAIAAAGAPLRGVVQAAGVLDDGVLGQQTTERFARVMAPKVAGTWHLHQALAGLELDFFVMFSSVASLLGSPGQGNHAAANAFLDALASHRRARGLPALSINWGAWARVGAAATRQVGARIATRGLGEMAPETALAAFDAVIPGARSQVGIAPVDWRPYRRQFADGQAPAFLADVLPSADSTPASSRHAAPTSALAAAVWAAAPGERRVLIARFLREQVATGLGLGAGRAIDPDTPLAALGLDSLLAVELRNALNRGLGLPRRLPATLLFDYPSVSALTEYLLGAIVEATAPGPAAPRASAPAVRAVTAAAAATDEDAIATMTDEEAEALLLKELE